MALTSRERHGILQTVLVRLNEGKSGPPGGYSEEERECYLELEQDILTDRKNGIEANYSFPNDYD